MLHVWRAKKVPEKKNIRNDLLVSRFGKKGGGKKGFHKMTDASKKKFMNAIFGESFDL